MPSDLPRPQLLIIGLDSAPWEIVDPLLERGLLPHLAALLSQGARAPLNSTIPAHSAAAWTTCLTGLNPGHHGIYHFLVFDPATYSSRPHGRYPEEANTLPGLYSAAGKRFTCLGVPMTYPPFTTAACCLSGFDSPQRGRSAVHPPELYDRLQERFDELTLGAAQQPPPFDVAPVLQEIERLTDLVLTIQHEQPAEALMVVYSQPDQTGHRTMPSFDPADDHHPLVQVYTALDRAVGRLLEELADDETTVIVLSDHGMHTPEWMVDLDALLRQIGLAANTSAAGRRREGLRALLRTGTKVLGAMGLGRLLDWARSRGGLTEAVSRLNPQRPENMDWSCVRAFATSVHGTIRLNLQGRESRGCVAPEQREAAVAEVIAALREVNAPDGLPLFADVVAAEQLYGGELVARETAPDVLIVPRRGFAFRSSLEGGDFQGGMLTEEVISAPSPRVADHLGTHHEEGLLICRSPQTPAGLRLEPADLQDIAPTVLHLSGLAVPEGLDGRVLTELLEPAFAAAHPVRYGAQASAGAPAERAAYTEEEEAAVEERLRDLGYL